MNIVYQLSVVSTLSVLVPLALSLWAGKKEHVHIRLFSAYLFFGLLTDGLSWYQWSVDSAPAVLNSFINSFYEFYSPVEALFFFG